MPRLPRRPALAILGIVALGSLALVGCGGGSDDDADGTGADATDATTTTEVVTAAARGEVANGEPVPSDGCGRTETRAVELEQQYLDDSDRWYLLTTPEEHDGETPLPVVIDFHGLMEGAQVHSLMSELSPFAQEQGFVLVLPNGTGTPIRWQISPDAEGNADLVYTAAMLDQLEQQLCIDTSRVYATGLSNGAMFSSAIGCTMSDRFAAIAPVAGVQHPSPCETDRPMPVLAFHGTEDPILLFNGGVGGRLNEVMEDPNSAGTNAEPLPEADLEGEGYPESVRAWAAANGCEPEPVDEQLTDSALLRTYDCPAEGAVEFVVSEGGGHTWPGSQFGVDLENIMGPTDLSIEANELLWAFFQRFQLPQA